MNKYGAALFPLLRHYICALCEKKAAPFRVNTVLQWYRVVVLGLFSLRASFVDVHTPDVFPILSDVSTVLKSYLHEKSVVQGCVGTLLVTTESSCFISYAVLTHSRREVPRVRLLPRERGLREPDPRSVRARVVDELSLPVPSHHRRGGWSIRMSVISRTRRRRHEAGVSRAPASALLDSRPVSCRQRIQVRVQLP